MVTPKNKEPRMAFFLLETELSDDGQYIPCIAVEGETGYHLTDWRWGKDLQLARRFCDERNSDAGLSRREAAKIQLGTMRKRQDEM